MAMCAAVTANIGNAEFCLFLRLLQVPRSHMFSPAAVSQPAQSHAYFKEPLKKTRRLLVIGPLQSV